MKKPVAIAFGAFFCLIVITCFAVYFKAAHEAEVNKERSKLRLLGLAIHNYSLQHEGEYPPSLKHPELQPYIGEPLHELMNSPQLTYIPPVRGITRARLPMLVLQVEDGVMTCQRDLAIKTRKVEITMQPR